MPADAGSQGRNVPRRFNLMPSWIPACAGMTGFRLRGNDRLYAARSSLNDVIVSEPASGLSLKYVMLSRSSLRPSAYSIGR